MGPSGLQAAALSKRPRPRPLAAPHQPAPHFLAQPAETMSLWSGPGRLYLEKGDGHCQGAKRLPATPGTPSPPCWSGSPRMVVRSRPRGPCGRSKSALLTMAQPLLHQNPSTSRVRGLSQTVTFPTPMPPSLLCQARQQLAQPSLASSIGHTAKMAFVKVSPAS